STVKKITLSIVAVPLLWCAAASRHAAPAISIPALADGSGLSVVTLNMAKETDTERILSEFRGTPALRNPDILLLQEVKDNAALDLATGLGLHVARHQALNSAEQGLAILSRWPLSDIRVIQLPAYELAFHSRLRFALAATAATPAGPLRICT